MAKMRFLLAALLVSVACSGTSRDDEGDPPSNDEKVEDGGTTADAGPEEAIKLRNLSARVLEQNGFWAVRLAFTVKNETSLPIVACEVGQVWDGANFNKNVQLNTTCYSSSCFGRTSLTGLYDGEPVNFDALCTLEAGGATPLLTVDAWGVGQNHACTKAKGDCPKQSDATYTLVLRGVLEDGSKWEAMGTVDL